MKKTIRIVFVLVAIGAIAAVTYLKLNKDEKVAIEKFIGNSTEIAYYTNFQSEEYKELIKINQEYEEEIFNLYKELYTEEQYKILKDFYKASQSMQEYANESLLVVDAINYESVTGPESLNFAFIVDFNSAFTDIALKKNFRKEANDIYILNDEKFNEDLDKYLELLFSQEGFGQNQGVEQVDFEQMKDKAKEISKEVNLYVRKLNGLYAFSTSKNYLIDLDKNIKEENTEFLTKYNEIKNKQYSFFLADGNAILSRYSYILPANEYISSLGYIYTNIEYDKGNVDYRLKIEGQGSLFTALDSSQVSARKITNYATGPVSLYFANNNIAELAQFINNTYATVSGIDYFQFIQIMAGINPVEIISTLGNEVVFNFDMSTEEYSLVLNNEEPQIIEEFLSSMGVPKVEDTYDFNGTKLTLNDNLLFINESQKGEDTIKDTNNLALYFNMDLDNIFETLPELATLYEEKNNLFFQANLAIYTSSDYIEVASNYEIDELMKFLSSYPELLPYLEQLK